jgi:hypothetical protein
MEDPLQDTNGQESIGDPSEANIEGSPGSKGKPLTFIFVTPADGLQDIVHNREPAEPPRSWGLDIKVVETRPDRVVEPVT